jgi:hypothetical protein
MKRMDLQTQFLGILTRAQKFRDERLDWRTYERAVMLEEVNRKRRGLAKAALKEHDISNIECLALGHTDFPQKFALYCTELVLDRS